MSPRLLIFGFGYSARFLTQAMSLINGQVIATTRSGADVGYNHRYNCQLIAFSEQDVERALLSASHVLISVPPMPDIGDPVLEAFGHLLQKNRQNLQWLGYLSSTGIYGDHAGNWVDESTLPQTLGKQSTLRLAAEKQWISFAKTAQLPLDIFRLAGIYGPQRNVLERLLQGKRDTVVKQGHFFSRIHVEDIVLALLAAIKNPRLGVNIYNVADDEPAAGHVVDEYGASLLQLPPLIKIAYENAILSPMGSEFYSHNKRVSNAKIKKELNIQLTYPTYKDGLASLLNCEKAS